MTEQQEVAAIPLVEERAVVTKREIETGRIRVKVSVQEREDQIPVELAHDDVEIVRVPVNKVVGQLPSVRLEGSTTIIPVVEEVVVVEKRLVVVEEIHVRRKCNVELRHIPVILKSEQVDVETSGATAGASSSNERALDGGGA